MAPRTTRTPRCWLAGARGVSHPLCLAKQPAQENGVQPRRARGARRADRRAGQRRRNAAGRVADLQVGLGLDPARAPRLLRGRDRPVRPARWLRRRRPLSAGRVRQHRRRRVFPPPHQGREVRLHAHQRAAQVSLPRGRGRFRAGKPGVVGDLARRLSEPLHQPGGAGLPRQHGQPEPRHGRGGQQCPGPVPAGLGHAAAPS